MTDVENYNTAPERPTSIDTPVPYDKDSLFPSAVGNKEHYPREKPDDLNLPNVRLIEGKLTKENYRQFLVEHALRTVWCSPYQDKQYIFELSQLTPQYGVRDETELYDRPIRMPEPKSHFHIYMLGGNFASLFGLPEVVEQYIPIVDWCNFTRYHVKFYDGYGHVLPLHDVYYYKEYDDNLLLVIKDNPNHPIKLGKETLYMHIRSNHYWANLNEGVKDQQMRVLSNKLDKKKEVTEHLDLRVAIEKINDDVYLFQAGRPTGAFFNVNEYDSVDTISDGSIVRHEYHRVSDLKSYYSTLDQMNKLLLHLYPKEGDEYTIHYRDDIEIHLMKFENIRKNFNLQKPENVKILDKTPSTKGFYFYRNHEYSLRAVTHQSYGIPAEDLMNLIRYHDGDVDTNNLDKWFLKVSIRNSGLTRKLGAEKYRVYSLTQLPWNERVETLVSTESTMDVWKARNLEHSAYNFIMRAYREEITADRVLKAYGHDLTALALANPNVSPTDHGQEYYFVLPVGCADRSTIYEYARDGRLLGYYHHMEGFRYLPVHGRETVFIEAIVGLGSWLPSYYQDPEEIILDDMINYRGWGISTNSSGEVKYQEITKELGLNGDNSTPVLKFKPQTTYDSIIVMGDERFLAYDINLPRDNKGFYRFTLTQGKTRAPLPLTYSKISIWLNGYALIEGIDYILDFPYVTIVTKRGIDINEDQDLRVTVRCMGFPKSDGSRNPPKERGFVISNKISLDDSFILHQNTVSRIVVDGGVINPHALRFNQYGEAEVNLPNGCLYSIDDHFIAARGFAGHEELQDSQLEDEKIKEDIANYLKSKIPKNANHVPEKVTIKDPYPLYSPFISAVCTHIKSKPDAFYDFDFKDKTKIEKLVKPFKYLLKSDPAYIGYDEDFITVHPRPFILKDQEVIHHRLMGILEQCAKIYLKQPVDLNLWFKVVRTRKGN